MSIFDLFLSYHRSDGAAVQTIRQLLEARGVSTFLDREQLMAGLPWPQALENALQNVRGVAVFLGPDGLGLWQKREMYFALDRQVQEEAEGRVFPVIPVLLSGADFTPGFLFLNTWVDLRTDPPDPESLDTLVRAVRGDGTARRGLAEVAVCPYRGLRVFGEEDAAFFFGRDAFAERLRAAVRGRNFVAVVGPSGSGKSSVVQAGLIPLLRRQRPPNATWDAVVCTPGNRPFHYLARALIPLLESGLSETDRLVEARRLGDHLANGEVLLEDAVERLLSKLGGTDRLLLVVDQFEELFTLTPETDRQWFLQCLLQARNHTPLYVLLTLRADFYSHAIAASRDLSDALDQGVVNLGPMIQAELEQAVVKPAQRTGLGFEAGLVARILDDVMGEPGNLPLLEFALTELWTRRQGGRLTHAAYDALGGVEEALAVYAEQMYDDLSGEEQQQAQHVFIQLVRPGQGTDDIRRVATIAEVGETNWAIVARLADARLVVTSQDKDGEATAQIVHEALIRGWQRLRTWIEQDRGFRDWQELLRVAVQQWQTSGRDEGALLRGRPLADAAAWLQERSTDLSDGERGFIELSQALREREQAERAARDREAAERAAREHLRRRVTTVLSMGLLIVLILAGLAGLQWRRAEYLRQIGEEQRMIAVAQGQEAARQHQIARSLRLASDARNRLADRLDLALLLSLEARRIADTAEARGSQLASLNYSPHLTGFMRGHDSSVNAVVFSPVGAILASADSDGAIILWDMSARSQLDRLIGHIRRVESLAFSTDGTKLASGSRDGFILWDVATRRQLAVHRDSSKGGGGVVAISPDGNTLAFSRDGDIVLWDVVGNSQRATLPHFVPASDGAQEIILGASLAFSPDGTTLAAATTVGEIFLWNVATHKRAATLQGHTGVVSSVAFSPDGRTLVSAGADKSIILWDMATRSPLTRLTHHKSGVKIIAFSRDGATLASGSSDHTIILWDFTTRSQLAQFPDYTSDVRGMAFSPDGKTLAVAGFDEAIVLWDVASRSEYVQLLGHTAGVHRVAFSPDSSTLASGGADSSIILWDLATRSRLAQLPQLPGHSPYVGSIVFGPDGKTLSYASSDNAVVQWDIGAQSPRRNPMSSAALGATATFSPGGDILADAGSSSSVQTITLWDVATRSLRAQLPGLRFGARQLVFNHDGSTLGSSPLNRGEVHL